MFIEVLKLGIILFPFVIHECMNKICFVTMKVMYWGILLGVYIEMSGIFFVSWCLGKLVLGREKSRWVDFGNLF